MMKVVMQYRSNFVLLAICIAAFLISINRRVEYASSDPALTFVVSQSILENRTIALDAYVDRPLLDRDLDYFVEIGNAAYTNGQLYDFFPVGTAIIAVPMVAVARNYFGMDMTVAADNYGLQSMLAALSCALMIFLCYRIARIYVNKRFATLIASLSFFGSSLISSLGTAFWSINLTAIFVAMALYLIVRRENKPFDRGRDWKTIVEPLLIGGLLFLTYFTRASAASFVLVVLVYLWMRNQQNIANRRYALLASISAAALLGLFAIWSQATYGSILPPYYSFGRLQVERSPLWVALLGNTISPSRGIFIFSPFLLLPLIGYLWPNLINKSKREKVGWLVVGWFGLHLLILGRAVIWWGGNSYGPRLLAELWPGFVLLTAVAWRDVRPQLSDRNQRLAIIVYLILGGWAVYLHSWQGMYNSHTSGWHSFIEPVPVPPTSGLGDLFNWQYAQFFSSPDMLCRIQRDRVEAILPYESTLQPYVIGRTITYTADMRRNSREAAQAVADGVQFVHSPLADAGPYQIWLPYINQVSNSALFIGFEIDTPNNWRWTFCTHNEIIFQGPQESSNQPLALYIKASTLEEQSVTFALNGETVGSHRFTSEFGDEETVILPIENDSLRLNELNYITIYTPEARLASEALPRNSDPRTLGLAFEQLVIGLREQSPFVQPLPPADPPDQAYP